MAAPTFVGAGAGVTIASGSGAVTAAGSGVAIGDLVILQVLQDGTTASAVTYSAISGIANLAGTASSLTVLATDQQVGNPASARQHLRVGRATSTTCTVTVATTGDDLYFRIYVFRGVNTGTALTDILENGTAGTVTNGFGTGTSVTDTGVTTLAADRLALQLVGINDDSAIDAFAGATGGSWREAVAEYATATGTDGCIQLQTAEIGASANSGIATVYVTFGDSSLSQAFGAPFTAQYTGTIASVTFKADAVGGPTDDLTVEIRADASGSPSGTALGTTATIDVTGSVATYVATVNAPVTSGQPYWMVFRRTGAVDAATRYRLEQGGAGGGKTFDGTNWATTGTTIGYVISGSGAAGTIDGGSDTIATAGWGVLGFALKPLPTGTAHTVTPTDSIAFTDSLTPQKGKAVSIPDTLALADVFARATTTGRTVADTFALTDARAHARGITVGGAPSAFVAGDLQAGAGSTGGSGTFPTAALPASVVAGDLLLFFTSIQTETGVVLSEPAGWTLVFNETVAGGTGDALRAYSKTATGSDSAPSLTYTTGIGGWAAVIVRVRNVGGSPAQFTSQVSSTSTPSIDPPTAGSVKIAVAHLDPLAALGNLTWTGGATELVEVVNTTDAAIGIAYKIEDTAGAITSGGQWGANTSHIIFSIAPIAGAVDGVALTDSLSPVLGVAGVAHTRSVTDTLALLDSFARGMAYGRTQADGLTLLDQTIDAQGIRLGDVLALTDQLARIAATVRTFADTLALTDATTRAAGKTKALADTLALADQLARAVAKARSLADTIALTDQLTRATTKARTVADTLALADARALARGKVVADAVALVDQLTRIAPRIRTFADTVLLSDAVLTSKTGAGALNPADLIQIADQFTRIATYGRTITDPVALTDARSLGRGRRVADQVLLADLLARATGKTRTIADLIALTDFVVTYKVTGGNVLNYATDIRWGEIQADRVLVGVDEVWTP